MSEPRRPSPPSSKLSRPQRDRFLELLLPMRGRLSAYCRQIMWLSDDCEDVLQTAIAAAFADFGRFEEGTNFAAWIFAFVQNIAYSTNRKRQAFYATHDEVLESAGLELEAPFVDHESAHADLIHKSADLYEHFDDRVKRSLLQLSESERAALLLRSIGGFTYKEMASIMDRPIGTVMSSLCRARERMRAALVGYTAEIGWQPLPQGDAHGLP